MQYKPRKYGYNSFNIFIKKMDNDATCVSFVAAIKGVRMWLFKFVTFSNVSCVLTQTIVTRIIMNWMYIIDII